MTIICHVSDKKLNILKPQEPENAICFSENKFITYFGQYLYLFDLELMKNNFYIEKLSTDGLFFTQYLSESENMIKYKSQSLGWEYRIYKPIDVNKYSVGILEHWNHMKGIIGKGSVGEVMNKISIDLMRYPEKNLFSLTKGNSDV